MNMFGLFRKARPATTADTAKDRLKILLSQERSDRSRFDYLPLLKRDILEVIRRHMGVADDGVAVKVERTDDASRVEINIELPSIPARGAA